MSRVSAELNRGWERRRDKRVGMKTRKVALDAK
jgi:hypothetical protein